MSPAKRKESQNNNLLLGGGVLLVLLLAVLLSQLASRGNPFSFLGAAVGPSLLPPDDCVLEAEALENANAEVLRAIGEVSEAEEARDDLEAQQEAKFEEIESYFELLREAISERNNARDALADAEASGDPGLIEEASAALYAADDAVAAADEAYLQSLQESGALADLVAAARENVARLIQAEVDAREARTAARRAYDDCLAMTGGS